MSALEISLLCTFMSTYVTFFKEMEGLSVRLVVLLDDRSYSIHERKPELAMQRFDGEKETGGGSKNLL
jgi:hypothetical protein